MINSSQSQQKTKALTGAQAAVEAMRQIDPGVVAAYPITPQTPIMEDFSKLVANGKVNTELIRVESEHSAMSSVIGAQAAGVRAMTASSSAGLALMFEMLGVASGLRLPIVMHVANRALSSPINIHCDHSDTMGVREQGWIQLYAENPQEVYDLTFLALNLAEDLKVQLPALIAQDGFIISHAVEKVNILNNSVAEKLIGKYHAETNLLNHKKSETVGSLALPNFQMEIKQLQMEATENVLDIYPQMEAKVEKATGKSYPMVEKYSLKNANIALVALGSSTGTIRHTLKENPETAQSVGLLKIRLFRPFPYQKVGELLEQVEKVIVLDRTPTYGSGAPLYLDVKNSLYTFENKPEVESVIYGIGGRDFSSEDVLNIINEIK